MGEYPEYWLYFFLPAVGLIAMAAWLRFGDPSRRQTGLMTAGALVATLLIGAGTVLNLSLTVSTVIHVCTLLMAMGVTAAFWVLFRDSARGRRRKR